jgi:hypothetical protein
MRGQQLAGREPRWALAPSGRPQGDQLTWGASSATPGTSKARESGAWIQGVRLCVELAAFDSSHDQTEVTEFSPTDLTLGWFAETLRPGAVGVLGLREGLGGGAIQPSVRLDSCSYHMAVSFRRIAAVLVFCGVAED